MAGNLTDAAELLALDFIHGRGPTAPTTPLKARLMTALGSDSAAGTPVSGGGYADQSVTMGAAAAGAASNTGALSFTNMPACVVVGVEILSAGNVRIWSLPAAANKTVNAGDTYTIAAGAITVSLD